MVELQSTYSSSYKIYMQKLDVKPENYFVLQNPDAYVLKAISTQNYVNVGSPNNTQLYDLLIAHPGDYVEYNGTFYSAGYSFKTDSPPANSLLIIIAEMAICASAIGVIASLKTVAYMKNTHGKEI